MQAPRVDLVKDLFSFVTDLVASPEKVTSLINLRLRGVSIRRTRQAGTGYALEFEFDV